MVKASARLRKLSQKYNRGTAFWTTRSFGGLYNYRPTLVPACANFFWTFQYETVLTYFIIGLMLPVVTKYYNPITPQIPIQLGWAARFEFVNFEPSLKVWEQRNFGWSLPRFLWSREHARIPGTSRRERYKSLVLTPLRCLAATTGHVTLESLFDHSTDNSPLRVSNWTDGLKQQWFAGYPYNKEGVESVDRWTTPRRTVR